MIPTRVRTRERARDLCSRLARLPRIWLLVPLGLWLAWWAGSAVATEGSRRTFALSLAALFAVGAGVSLLTGRGVLFSGARQVAIGTAAAIVTFAVGTAIGVSVGG